MLHFFSKSLAVAVLLFLFFVAFGGASQSSKWRITEVNIVGAQVVDGDALLSSVKNKLVGNYFFVYARANSLIFPRREIEAEFLKSFPRLKNVTARASDAHVVMVEVAERKTSLLWCGEEFNAGAPALAECWLADEGGFIFDRAPIFSEGVYREIYGALLYTDEGAPLRARVPPLRYAFARGVEQGIGREFGDASRIFIKPESEYGIVIRSSALYPILSGAEIRFKDGQSIEHLTHNLLAALPVQFPADSIPQKKLQYIDLRFGNKVFFGFEE